MHPRDQTIFALSSGRPPTAIAVVRVSGPQAGTALTALAGKIPAARMATRALLRDRRQQPIDEAVVLWFPGPASATGEDVAEFHVHGGRAVLVALFAALSAFDHVRAAEPGEFTRRAFENGKLDLTEAEGLDDLVHADTDRQRRQALRQLKGLLGDRARDWRAQIIEAAALIEAGIDFSDEGDVPTELIGPALARIKALAGEIEQVLAAQGHGERLREGLVVAIVSPHAGTTRDIIEVQLDLDGYPVTVIDTAGIRETDDPVEQEGVRRARTRAAEADLVLWLVDVPHQKGLEQGAAPVWTVRNKIDLDAATSDAAGRGIGAVGSRQPAGAVGEERAGIEFAVSAIRGDGIQELIAALITFAQNYFGSGEGGLISRERQRQLLQETAASLRRSVSVIQQGEELAAEDLRLAARSLGRLLGRVDVEDLLDVIFREFCIGK